MVEEELAVADMMHNDPVTGLSNATGFEQIADHLLAMCRRTEAPASLVLFPFANQHLIEGFVGHDESERAAIELAQLLMSSFRDSDIVDATGLGLRVDSLHACKPGTYRPNRRAGQPSFACHTVEPQRQRRAQL